MPLKSNKVWSPHHSPLYPQWEHHNIQLLEQAEAMTYWFSASGILSDVDAPLFLFAFECFDNTISAIPEKIQFQ